jgi:hypothetical protein
MLRLNRGIRPDSAVGQGLSLLLKATRTTPGLVESKCASNWRLPILYIAVVGRCGNRLVPFTGGVGVGVCVCAPLIRFAPAKNYPPSIFKDNAGRPAG